MKTIELIELVQELELGLSVGRSWRSSLFESNSRLAARAREILRAVEVDESSWVLERAIQKTKDYRFRLLLYFLGHSQLGVVQLLHMLRRLREVLYHVYHLEKLQKSLFAIPKIQALLSLVLCALMSFVLPQLMPTQGVSFLSLDRVDLFAVGLIFMMVGFVLIFWIGRLSCCKLRKNIEFGFHFYSFSSILESGRDVLHAWNESIQLVGKEFSGLSLNEKDSKLVVEQLKLQQNDFPLLWRPCNEIIIKMLSCGLRDVEILQVAVQAQFHVLKLEYEEALRKCSVLSLLPLGFIVLPACLFLIFGPQFYIFFEKWRVL